MNKLILIKILKDIVDLYLKDELTNENYEITINKYHNITLTDDAVSFNESTFISFLFENIPYYKIIIILNKVLIKLSEISSNSIQKSIKTLLEAYLSDLFPSIYARLSTEVCAHISELLMIFYQRDYLENNDTLKRLTRNIITPNLLASVDTADQINYTQVSIPDFSTKSVSLRETISRTNFNRKSNIERSTLKMITKYYNEELYQKFLNELNEVFQQFSNTNNEDADILKDEIFSQLVPLHLKAKKKWEEPKQIDENQLTLKL